MFLKRSRVFECPRAAHHAGRHPRQIDYRHLIEALKRKPGAFACWTMRDDAFPRTIHRTTWDALVEQRPEREACKTMVELLALAADGHEAELAIELEALRALNELPELEAMTERFTIRQAALPILCVLLPDLSSYDVLLGAKP